MELNTVGTGAAKGALAGGAEIGAVCFAGLLISAGLQDAADDPTTLFKSIVGVVILLPFFGVAVVGVGLAVGWLVKLPMWWVALPAANAACVVVLALVRAVEGRIVLTTVVFTLAGALGARRSANQRTGTP